MAGKKREPVDHMPAVTLRGVRPQGPRGGPGLHKENRLTDAQRQALAVKAGGITPLEFAASVLRDKDAPMVEKRWAAELLMPYMHRKLPVAIEGAFMHGSPAEMAAMLPKLVVNFVEASEKK